MSIYSFVEKREIDKIRRGLRAKRTAIYIASLFLLGAVAAYLSMFLRIFDDSRTIILSGALAFAGLAILLYAYLWVSPEYTPEIKANASDLSRIRTLIFQIEQVVQSIDTFEANKNSLTPNEVAVIKSRVEGVFENISYSQITQDLEVEFDEQLFESKVGRQIIVNNAKQVLVFLRERLNQEIQAGYSATQEAKRSQENALLIGNRVHSRLQGEISQLFKLANIYIIFGTLVALIGGVYLYSAAQDILSALNESSGEVVDFANIKHKEILLIVLRLSIVLFIEVFAFYFLRLHKEAMENVKYYQNELTNVDLKTIALNAAYGTPEAKALEIIVSELSITERNFILKGKQTTVEIERRKSDKALFTEALDKLAVIFKKKD